MSACSSDDDTTAASGGAGGKAGAAGKAGEAGSAGNFFSDGGCFCGTEAGSGGLIGISGAPAEGGAAGSAGSPSATGGTGGTGGAATRTCIAAGDIDVSALPTLKYVINLEQDPTLTFCRGSTYNFVLDASTASHPFYIKTVDNSTGTANAFTEGVTGNGNTSGAVVFTVPADAPDTLYYHCSSHAGMGGKITIVD